MDISPETRLPICPRPTSETDKPTSTVNFADGARFLCLPSRCSGSGTSQEAGWVAANLGRTSALRLKWPPCDPEPLIQSSAIPSAQAPWRCADPRPEGQQKGASGRFRPNESDPASLGRQDEVPDCWLQQHRVIGFTRPQTRRRDMRLTSQMQCFRVCHVVVPRCSSQSGAEHSHRPRICRRLRPGCRRPN